MLRTLSEEDRPLWTKMSFAAAQPLQERGMIRPDALAEILRLYCQRMHSNEPLHTWDIAD